ncbi:MAG: ABC transporter permease [Phycisphaerae bacterium]|nr:ABC transporter permease [Phycisphaerae bacterium]
MYKLILCLRYLRSRLIAYFAILGVALCVAMVLIVISVMNGFLDKIEEAAKGLRGDIIVYSPSHGGIEHYEAFIARLKQEVPEVEAATPYIQTYGLLRVPDQDYRRTVHIVGVRLPGSPESDGARAMDYYTDVSTFAEGLFAQSQRKQPGFDPPPELILTHIERDMKRIGAISADYPDDPTVQSAVQAASVFHRGARQVLRQQEFVSQQLAQLEELLRQAEQSDGTDDELSWLENAVFDHLKALIEQGGFGEDFRPFENRMQSPEWKREPSDLTEPARIEKLRSLLRDIIRTLRTKRYRSADRRVILGLGIPGLSVRAPDGRVIRMIVPGNTIGLSLLPLGRKYVSDTSVTPVSAWFTVVDDARTDVSEIDQTFVYMPFETLQKLNQMGAEKTPEGVTVRPKRCSSIFIKVRTDAADRAALAGVASKVRRLMGEFGLEDRAVAETWRQHHAQIIGTIEKQRTLAVTMFGIISLVSVVLIFVIFYMMVVQKTRDIGVIKAVGGSDTGVAGIFLGYGAAIGLIGSILGSVGGYFFVRYINEIQDAIDRWFGYRVWDRDVFLFERIPNEVNPPAAAAIIVGAIVAGLLGALIPSIRAARMQPVEALRYE